MERNATMLPLILAGGSGSRLWPLSRQLFPKQFLALDGGQVSLFQQTLKRTGALESAGKPLVIANDVHRFLVKEQAELAGFSELTLMLEPFGRNTAVAVALGLAHAQKNGLRTLLVLPSDHLMQDIEEFSAAVAKAEALAAAGYLTTFGIQPVRPETGYGYIKRGQAIASAGPESTNKSDCGFKVEDFIEKPDKATAIAYLQDEKYLWNSGLFLFPVDRTIEEFKQKAPEIWQVAISSLQGSKQVSEDGFDIYEIDETNYKSCQNTSIDYAIMEKTNAAAVVPYQADWSDLGAWQSVWQAAKKDSEDNVKSGDALVNECKGCYVSAGSRLVTLVGMENTLVVETADAVLVADLSDTQKVKALVQHLEKQNRSEVNAHTRVYRPWGWYEQLCGGERFQVKRIMVKAGQSLSLQKHHHRAEHWVVVKGTAEITRDNEKIMLTEDQSSYIPLGLKHRLKNPGIIPLEIIEVQTGSYLGEDDIVRYQDTYGRKVEEQEA